MVDNDTTFLFVILGAMAFVMVIIGLALVLRPRSSDGSPTDSVSRSSVSLRQRAQLSSLPHRFGGTVDGDSFRVERDGHTVKVAFIRTAVGDTERVVTQLLVSGDLAPIDVGPESVRSSNDIQTGDDNFDGLADISGDPAMALAVLGPETRRKLGPALMQGWTVDKSPHSAHLRREFSGEHMDGMTSHIEAGLALARLLARPPNLHAALIARLSTEPSLAGRVAIATHLPNAIQNDPPHLAALVAHPDREVRLVATARIDHPDLWATLAEDHLIALTHQTPHPPHTKHSLAAVTEAAVTALGRMGSARSVPALKRVASTGGDIGRLAADTILTVQSRLSGSRGELALASEADGALALSSPQPPP